MRPTIIAIILGCYAMACAEDESADDIAKRVIKDKSAMFVPSGTYAPKEKSPEEKVIDASKDDLSAYMLGDEVSEKVRIAYAIFVLDIKNSKSLELRLDKKLIESKHRQNLEDTRVLTRRWIEIYKAEQAGTGQPATRSQSKSEGNDKPQPEAEGRSR